MAVNVTIEGREKPVPRSQRASVSRADQFRRCADEVKDISVLQYATATQHGEPTLIANLPLY